MTQDNGRKPDKDYTFHIFDEKWRRSQGWAKATEKTYRRWYLERYGYGDEEGLKAFLLGRHTILEAGCGQARDSRMFAELCPNARVYAMDQSPHALEEAKLNLEGLSNCEVLRADITTFDIPDALDFISCDQVMHHTTDPAATLRHLFSRLAIGGVLNFCVCRKKGAEREVVDSLIMAHAEDMMTPEELWSFSQKVTELGKALYELGIADVHFEGKTYPSLQRFVHNRVFRCWFDPDIPFNLSVSSNFDWFSNNPRFSWEDVDGMLATLISDTYEVTRVHSDDAVISVSLKRLS